METGEQLGGLQKKYEYLKHFRELKNLLILDSGDLLSEKTEIQDSVRAAAELKANVISEIYNKIGIDAVNVGETDLALGLDFLKNLEKKYDMPFVSANLTDENNRLLFKKYVIKEINGIKTGIFGIMGNDRELTGGINSISGGKIKISDPLEAAESVVNELKERTDLIIALTHQQMGRNWVVARKVNEIDIIIGGHHKQKIREPYVAGNTRIVQCGEKGQYLGIIEAVISGSGEKEIKNTLVALGSKIADDPGIKRMINDYNKDVASLFSPGLNNILSNELKVFQCKSCHSSAVAVWEKSGHARAFGTLEKKTRHYNPDCLACHTTLFEQPGGFSMKNMEAELKNVQCDSCHGSSNDHLKDSSILPGQEAGLKTCVKCHTPDRCPDFVKNYSEEWWKIRH